MVSVTVFGAPVGQGHKTEGVWRDAAVMIESLLGKANLDGEFRMKPISKARWHGTNGKGAVKLNGVEYGGVALRIKSPDSDNGGCWNYRLFAPSGGEPFESFSRLTEVLNAPAALPKVVPASIEPPAEVQKQPEPTLLERVRRLQEAAVRTKRRAEHVNYLNAQRAKIRAEIASLNESLADLDTQELMVIQETETDKESQQAEDVLAALSSLFKDAC